MILYIVDMEEKKPSNNDIVKNLEELISDIAEGTEINANAFASILPPPEKLSTLVIYDLQKRHAEYYFSMVFQYKPKCELRAVPEQGENLESKFTESGAVPLRIKDAAKGPSASVGYSLLEMRATVDLETPSETDINMKESGLLMSDISADGAIKKIIESTYWDVDEKEPKRLESYRWILDEEGARGILFEYDLSQDFQAEATGLKVSVASKPRVYAILNGKLDERPYGPVDFLPAQKSALEFAKRNSRITSVAAYFDGKPISFLELLKDMRRWHTQPVDPAYT
jgi:hypothetical protein